MDDIIKYKENHFIPKKFMINLKFMELFTDLTKKIDEWNFWKKQVIISYAKILITLESYNFRSKTPSRLLKRFIKLHRTSF